MLCDGIEKHSRFNQLTDLFKEVRIPREENEVTVIRKSDVLKRCRQHCENLMTFEETSERTILTTPGEHESPILFSEDEDAF